MLAGARRARVGKGIAMADLMMLYRLIILYMLKVSKEPVRNTQITIFVLDKQYTNFFTIQDAVADLVDAKLIDPVPVKGNTVYLLNDDGRATLAAYEKEISPKIKADVEQFFGAVEKEKEAAADRTYAASYSERKDGSYEVVCGVLSGRKSVMTVTVTVTDEEQAEAVCRNWRKQHIEIYTNLMYELLR